MGLRGHSSGEASGYRAAGKLVMKMGNQYYIRQRDKGVNVVFHSPSIVASVA